MYQENSSSEDWGVGIYKITMRAYPKPRILYIGQSKYLKERIRDHKVLLRKGKHHNQHLQNIYNKHGFSGMVFEVICNCSISELDTMEQFYIDELKPECNIVKDVRNFYEKFYIPKETVLMDTDVVGLELDWHPQNWHKWVYGSGRK